MNHRSILFVFHLFCAQLSFAQNLSTTEGGELKQAILGDWYLTEIKVTEGYDLSDDSTSFISYKNKNTKITFSKDSVQTFPAQNQDSFYERFWRIGNSIGYSIENDTSINRKSLNILTSNKKKKKILSSFEIVKCSIDELILKSSEYHGYGLQMMYLSVFYVYQREGVDSLLNALKGEWYNSSLTYVSLSWSNLNTDEITFNRLKSPPLDSRNEHHIELKFFRKNYENYCDIFNDYSVIGTGSIEKIALDPKNKMIYFGDSKFWAYKIISLNQDKLVIARHVETQF
jgi:hypothetical protein